MCLGGGREVGALGGGVESWLNCSPFPWPPARHSTLYSQSRLPPPLQGLPRAVASLPSSRAGCRNPEGLEQEGHLYNMVPVPHMVMGG